jgi:UDP-N-acetylmuramoyl-tripeptide--D-alanyl-D-alanine ligase
LTTPIPANRAPFTPAEAARASAGRLVEVDAHSGLVGVSTDSRTAPAGGLFVALRGETHDGHRFVAAARERGALPLVAADAGIEGPRIEVADTLTALGGLARVHVDRVFAAGGRRPVLAIGGAAGKTTTKTLAAAAVGALFGETLVTPGNLNNRIGVPMTLLTLEPRHRALVVECGTSVPGEIAALGRIARPDVGLVTNVGLEHTERLGGLEQIADEEAALLLAASAVAITNGDEPLLVARLAAASAPIRLTFGSGRVADLRLASRTVDAGGASMLRLQAGARLMDAGAESSDADPGAPVEPGATVAVTTWLLGRASALNLAAALAGALALLGRPATRAQAEAAAAALAAVEAVPGRLRPLELRGVFVIDDTYNSNPKSVPVALEAAAEIALRRRARLVVALGDMLELGGLSGLAHDEMVRAAGASGAERLVLVGPESSAAATRARPATTPRLFPDSAAAAAEIAGMVGPGDVLLVKGSRGTRMERLLEALGSPGE